LASRAGPLLRRVSTGAAVADAGLLTWLLFPFGFIGARGEAASGALFAEPP